MRKTIIVALLAFVFGLACRTMPATAQASDPCAPTATATATATNTPTSTTTPSPTPTASPTASPTPTPSATPSATLTPVPQSGVSIYADAFGPGWSRQSPGGWTASWSMTSVDEVTSPVYEGSKAWRLVYQGWGGFQIMRTTPITLTGTLAFAHQGAGRYEVYMSRAGGGTTLGTFTTGPAWAVTRFALPAAGLVGVTELTFKNLDNAARTLYLDAIAIEGTGAGPASSPTATTVPATPTRTPTTAPIGSALRILPLGDSITEGVNGGYRVGLWNRLIGAGYTVDYVGPRSDQFAAIPDKDHAGTPGYNTGNILSAIDGYMSTYQPNLVLLMIGTNDLAWWTADTNAAANTAANVGRILDRIEAARPGTRVILATTPPISSNVIQVVNLDRADLMHQYNAALRTLTQQRGVRLIDVEAALTLSDLYDGVHPDQAAHDRIAALWFQAITTP